MLPDQAALVEVQRQADALIARRLLGRLALLFDGVGVELPSRWAAVEPLVVALTVQAGGESSEVAVGVYRRMRLAAGVESAFTPVIVRPDPLVVSRQLLRTGPSAWADGPTNELVDRATTRVGGNATRVARDAGRDTTLATVDGDEDALGWARVSSGDPCGFCALLVSRGAVYSGRSVSFRSHDHCSCSARPVFDHVDAVSDQARKFRQVYDEFAAGRSSKSAIAAMNAAFR